MSKPVEAEVVLSHSEHLPAVDVWMIIDVLRASTVMVRWFEMGGKELYPAGSIEHARQLAERLRHEGGTPLLMGEQNAIAPQGFDLGNSPLDITEELTRSHTSAVMATTNGTKAMLRASETGTPVLVACARNAYAALDLALTKGRRIGIFCSGRRGRPAWDDTLCAGLLISRLTEIRPDIHLADSARLAHLAWRSSRDFKTSLRSADHAVFLEKIGYGDDIVFAAEINATSSVPELHELPGPDGMLACLREGATNVTAAPIQRQPEKDMPAPFRNSDLSIPEPASNDLLWRTASPADTKTKSDLSHVFLAGEGFKKQHRNKSKKA